MRDVGRMGMLGLISMGAAITLASAEVPARLDVMPSKKRYRTSARHIAPNCTTLHAMNGKRECERRRRQIAAGSLRVENGLVA